MTENSDLDDKVIEVRPDSEPGRASPEGMATIAGLAGVGYVASQCKDVLAQAYESNPGALVAASAFLALGAGLVYRYCTRTRENQE